MQALYDYIAGQYDEMLALLETIVNVDSGTYDKPGIDQVARILAGRVSALGLDTELILQPVRGDHVLGRKTGRSPLKVLFVGHCDTVFGAGTVALRPFRKDDQRAYGPGVVDMKGGLVAMLTALAGLKTTQPQMWDDLGITIVINSDEEIASPTSRPIIEAEAKKADLVCVLEPARPGGEVVSQRKGAGTYYLRIKGKAAHAGLRPQDGASAIHELCQKVTAILALQPPEGVTINVGVIRGGTRSNVVSDAAEAEIDVRVPTLADGDWVEAALQGITAHTHVAGTRSELSGGVGFPPMPRTETIMGLFRLAQQAAAEVGITLDHIATGGGSDGNYASQFAPTLDGLGVHGAGAHTEDEFIWLESLVQRSQILARFLTLWYAQKTEG